MAAHIGAAQRVALVIVQLRPQGAQAGRLGGEALQVKRELLPRLRQAVRRAAPKGGLAPSGGGQRLR